MTEWVLYVSMAVVIRGAPGWIDVEPDGQRIFAAKEKCVAAGKNFAGFGTKVRCVPQWQPHGISLMPPHFQEKTIEVKP